MTIAPSASPHSPPLGSSTNVVRDVPVPDPLFHGVADEYPERPSEPILDVNDIQGNILGGFNKDYQTLVFLTIEDPLEFKGWLQELVPFIATSAEVVAFNRLFKYIRGRRKSGDAGIHATWLNVAFSHAALQRLTASTTLDLALQDFDDVAFRQGLAARAHLLNDPADPADEGNPVRWKVGGPENAPADVVFIVASDHESDLAEQVNSLVAEMRGATVAFVQPGAVRSDLRGHEHFGFLDGVSQPGLRGRLSADKDDLLTARQNPRDRDNQGKPGQDLLWPGEFVFGYEGQDPKKAVSERGARKHAGPAWADNGSFLVFRRLRQDVGGFHGFLNAQATRHGISPDELGARVIGRWADGSPVERADQPNAGIGDNDCANNSFEFVHGDPSLTDPNVMGPPDTLNGPQCAAPSLFTVPVADASGMVCPFAGHIRKAYPRDDITPAGAGAGSVDQQSEISERDTQTHRLLRRGIPFGDPSTSTPALPVVDDQDRGLVFLAYQTSIVNQFEFVTQNWVNNPDFAHEGAGFDMVIGQSASPTRERSFALDIRGQAVHLRTTTDWVIPTGGGYYFAPSISALGHLSDPMDGRSNNHTIEGDIVTTTPAVSLEQYINAQNPYGNYPIAFTPDDPSPVNPLNAQTLIPDPTKTADTTIRSDGAGVALNINNSLFATPNKPLLDEIMKAIKRRLPTIPMTPAQLEQQSEDGLWWDFGGRHLHVTKALRIPYEYPELDPATGQPLEDANGQLKMRTGHILIGYEGWVP